MFYVEIFVIIQRVLVFVSYCNIANFNRSHNLNYLLLFCSVIQDKFCGIINICVEALHDVMSEDPDSGTYKE